MKCDECGREFNEKDMITCTLNGSDKPCMVCKDCCSKCGYNEDWECTFEK